MKDWNFLRVFTIQILKLSSLGREFYTLCAPFEQATGVMLEVFSGTSEVFTKKILADRAHLEDAQKLCESAQKAHYSSPQLLQLKICIFECLMGGLRDFPAAEICLKDIECDFKKGYTVEPYYMALFNMNKGCFETTYPHYENGIYYMQRGLEILNDLKGHDEEILRGLTNLAQYHLYLGETDIADSFIEKGKKIFEKSKSELFNCFFLYVWGYLLNEQGKFEDSLKILKKAELYPNLGANYPTIEFFILYQKTRALIKLNRLKEARKTLSDCGEKAKKFYRSTDTMFNTNILFSEALISIQENTDIQKAITKLQKALQAYEDFFHGSNKHVGEGRIHLALGKAYMKQQNTSKALEEYLLSDGTYTAVVKEKKLDDVGELYKELVLLGAQLKNEDLVHKYLEAHITTFGRTHPRTQEIILFLDKHGIL